MKFGLLCFTDPYDPATSGFEEPGPGQPIRPPQACYNGPMRTVLTLAAAAVLLAAAPPRPRTGLLVSTEWLNGNLKDPAVVVLHVANARTQYDQAHIPGARLLLMSDITTVRDGNSAELPAPEALRAVFERLGVSGSSRVILYGDTLAATRAFFTLDYLGHTGAALLDGGLEKWRAEGRPLTADVPSVKPGVFNVKPRPEVVVTFEQMRKLSEAAQQPGSGVVIIDSRSPEVAAKGRIPGAKVVYWADAQRGRDDPTLKAAEDIARLYGLDALKTVVTYCNSGVQATHGYFVLRYLGYDDVRMYDGSFSEWSRHPEVLIQH